MGEDISVILQTLRKQDPDRFFLSLFAAAERRPALWALFAFHHEIAKTREVVSETRLGLIRLQWWREHIAAIYEGRGPPPGQPLLQALVEVIAAHDLPRDEFETLLYAREFDLEDVLPGTAEGLRRYIDLTQTPLMRLALRCAGQEEREDATIGAVSVNLGLAGLMRAVPFHAAQGRCFLPQDSVDRHGIRLNSGLYAGRDQEGLQAAVADVMAGFKPGIRPQSRLLKAAQAMAEIDHAHLRRCGFDPYAPRLAIPAPFRALRVWALSVFT